ncbi:MAG: carbon monoxide dehydrogenase [Acidimicrobiaceae bacterium]|nr:carbon monoxide dehydrogenase [Acidimicrobiaceae bacterium]MYD06187.1 carbon monoxide dehydrogenase [Acidimicrobiaceae bacterium]MYI57433.1 carbon monoxide dehydrogenase [Acidimicrobiaceae bacterium]
MDLNNSFEVARPIDEAWAVLTDLERIAPCLPGAQLTEVEGDDYRGFVKVKVGPITAQFKGAANFVERNDQDHKAVLSGKGRDTRGAGNASALITAKLEEVSDSTTRVNVDTDMKITGKFAQFGRGVMADVSANLMDQFAQNLAEMLAEDGTDSAQDPGDAAMAEAAAVDASSDAGDADTEAAGGEAAKPDGAARKIEMPEPEAIDLIDAAAAPVMKRMATLAAVVVAFLVLRRLLRRSR